MCMSQNEINLLKFSSAGMILNRLYKRWTTKKLSRDDQYY